MWPADHLTIKQTNKQKPNQNTYRAGNCGQLGSLIVFLPVKQIKKKKKMNTVLKSPTAIYRQPSWGLPLTKIS